MITEVQKRFFQQEGYLVLEDLITEEEVLGLRSIYEAFLNEEISTQGQRSDLSGRTAPGEKEKIVQIMRPSVLHPVLMTSNYHCSASQAAKALLGDDMVLDFDMLIDKPPHSNAITPWHQDEAYWIEMSDKRAVSCWLALDDVKVDNGCMWFIPKSHREGPLRVHHQTGKGGALVCEASEAEGLPIEIKAGSCTFHAGRTLHYARGNSTDQRRRAFITNFRPKAMVDFSRAKGFDHLGKRTVRQ